jgi:hypothetical protein
MPVLTLCTRICLRGVRTSKTFPLDVPGGAAVSDQLKRLAESMKEDSSLKRKHEKVAAKIQPAIKTWRVGGNRPLGKLRS